MKAQFLILNISHESNAVENECFMLEQHSLYPSFFRLHLFLRFPLYEKMPFLQPHVHG